MNEGSPRGRFIAWGALAVVLVGIAIRGFFTRNVSPASSTSARARLALPVLFDAPNFTLTDRSGRQLSRADLHGRVWIADFIFTYCAGPCPIMTQTLGGLQKNFAAQDAISFVTFTVDPERDTPDVLAAYAKRHDADPKRWYFLTGEKSYVRHLIGDGFKLVARESTPEEREKKMMDDILHSTYFLLIDSDGLVRGIYDSGGAADMPRLLIDARRLLDSGGR